MELNDYSGGTSNHIDGDNLGSAVQAHSIAGGVHFYLASPPEPTAQPEHAPANWAERPELPTEIRFLLRTQILAAQQLPYRLPGARRPSLATVYVRQDLGSGAEASGTEQEPRPILDSRGQLAEIPGPRIIRPTVRPPSRTVRDALDGDDHLVITGGPGQGKSTLSLRLAADIAGRWGDEEMTPLTEPVVPLRLTARELATKLDLPFPQALSESVAAEYGALLACPVPAQSLGERMAGCRWLLLVDGLDEVADADQRNRLVDVLTAWTTAESPYRVVLTTRPVEGAALAPLQRIGVARYELQPFDEEALHRFADNWFDGEGDRSQLFMRQVREAHLVELAEVPLLATIAAIIFEQHGGRPLPGNRYALYEAYLKYLRTGPGPFDPWLDAVLEHLGRVRLEADTSLVTAAHTWAADHIPAADLGCDWRDRLIARLAAVGPIARRGDDIGFIHHSFAEHLAATAKARLLPEQFTPKHKDFVDLLHAARPRERGRYARLVLLHYGHLQPREGDRLLRWLHIGDAEQHLLAARLLAWHLPAERAAMDTFLVVVRAWAMTSRYPAAEMLSETSRAAHHPALPQWLFDLMNDADAPWGTRVEAAAALATRLRGVHTPAAVAVLQEAAVDESVPVRDRLVAAEALSRCGIEQRKAAVRGLAAVLADPSANATYCRTAAIVLAGLGTDARSRAVSALRNLLDNPDTPDDDLVDAALALVEIGPDWHERCAETFRARLAKHRGTSPSMRNAAVGLASLGPKHLAEAVAALEKIIGDPFRTGFVRTAAAQAMAELGPAHRTTAGALLVTAAGLHSTSLDCADIAQALVNLGPEFHERAADMARTVFADRSASPYSVLSAAQALLDLGPDYHLEAARELTRVANHPLPNSYERPAALGYLAELGEPHRTPAIVALRTILADRDEDMSTRANAASQLLSLGPEHHAEVVEQLLAEATRSGDPRARETAWRQLRGLGSEVSGRARSALMELVGPAAAASWESHGTDPFIAQMDTDTPVVAAAAIQAVFQDPARSTRIRVACARNLVNLGRRHHRSAVEGLVHLLRTDSVPDEKLLSAILRFTDVSADLRAAIYSAMRSTILDPDMSINRVEAVASALKEFDGQLDPQVAAALQDIAVDGTADARVRVRAALLSVQSQRLSGADIVGLVMRLHRDMLVSDWDRCVRALLNFGVDLAPALRSLVSGESVARGIRETAAELLVRLSPRLGGEGLVELRTQAADEFLAFPERTDPIRTLARLDPTTVDDAIAYHRSIAEDEQQPIPYRCEAAYQLAALDQSATSCALATLRRLAVDLELSPGDRGEAIEWMGPLGPSSAEMLRVLLPIVNDPAAPSGLRGRLADKLPGKQARVVRRSLLTDYMASPATRLSQVDEWHDRALAASAVEVIQDVIAGAESSPAERVEAVAGLLKVSRASRDEALGLLGELAEDRRCGPHARLKLAQLSRTWRSRVLTDACRTFSDNSVRRRERDAACRLAFRMSSEPSEPTLDYFKRLLLDSRTSDYARLNILFALGQFDDVRAIRDDAQRDPATRWTAANLLRDYGAPDRAVGAAVLNAIATNTGCRPALRWRAAADLTRFGERGRVWGVATLHSIITDTALPPTIRIDATRALGVARPDRRPELLHLLHDLSTSGHPAVRLRALTTIGTFDPAEGALALNAMIQEATLSSPLRLRCAATMATLHRDLRDSAATVAYDIAYDPAVASHVRVKAACLLAQLSQPCRTQARRLLAELGQMLPAAFAVTLINRHGATAG